MAIAINRAGISIDLEQYGITEVEQVYYNLSYEVLFKHEMDPSLVGFERGKLSNLGAVNVDTGIFTGRSPKDKYIVLDAVSENTVWWSTKINTLFWMQFLKIQFGGQLLERMTTNRFHLKYGIN